MQPMMMAGVGANAFPDADHLNDETTSVPIGGMAMNVVLPFETKKKKKEN